MTNPVASDTNPWFPYAYASAYTGSFNQRTLSQELDLATFVRTATEVRRMFIGLQLHIWTHHRVRLGIGTAWRVQPADKPGHASPGNSWHEGIPVASKVNAMAIDTVGALEDGTAAHGQAWDLQERYCEQFGFVSFRYLNDRPHIQPLAIPRARRYVDSTDRLPTWPLPHIAIEPRFDIDYINPDDPLAGTPVPPVVVPPVQPPSPTYPVPPGSFTVPTLTSVRKGAPNNPAHVQVMQSQLNRWVGYAVRANGPIYAGPIIAEDGGFGNATDAALRAFQSAAGTTVDGVCGPQTWALLYSDC